MKIHCLGTNGFFPSNGRHTACFAVPIGKTLVILDAGTGLFRFAEKQSRDILSKVEEVHIYLSHYHMDHTFGFYGAFSLFKKLPVRVFSPSGRKVFSEFARLDHFPIDYEREHSNFHWEKISEGIYDLDKYSVNIINQNHRGELSLGFRFSFGVGYITDGEPNRKVVKAVSGAPVLLCESMSNGTEVKSYRYLGIEKQILDGHITGIGAAMIAGEAGVGKLILIHHNPYHDQKDLDTKLKEARTIFQNTILGMDGKVIVIPK